MRVEKEFEINEGEFDRFRRRRFKWLKGEGERVGREFEQIEREVEKV